jgi:hypothetical protein
MAMRESRRIRRTGDALVRRLPVSFPLVLGALTFALYKIQEKINPRLGVIVVVSKPQIRVHICPI